MQIGGNNVQVNVLSSKDPAHIHLEMISKVFIILFLLYLWGLGTKTDQNDFFQISALIYSLLGQTEGKRSFWKGQARMLQVEITPK